MKTKQEVLLCGFSAQELCGAWQLWHLGQLRFLIDLIPIILWWNLKRKSRSSLLAYDYLFILCLDPVVAKIDDRCKTNTVIRHCPPFCPVEYVIIQCSVVLCWSHQLFTHVNNAPVDLTCACAVTDTSSTYFLIMMMQQRTARRSLASKKLTIGSCQAQQQLEGSLIGTRLNMLECLDNHFLSFQV